MRLRKPLPPTDELLDLPPLDGEVDEHAPDAAELLPDLFDDGEGADDSVAGDGFDDDLPDADDASTGLDDLDGTDDDHDGFDTVVLSRDAPSAGDDDGPDEAHEAWFDEAPAEVDDDQGEEGIEASTFDLVGGLPPLDDDAEGDALPDEAVPAPVAMTLPGFVLEDAGPPSARVRMVRGATVGEGVVLGVAVALTLADDGLWAVGDAVARLDRANFDDEAPSFSAVDAPGGEVFTGVAVGADGVPLVATLGGEVLVATRRGSWRPLGVSGQGRSAGPTRLHADGARVWCVDAVGRLTAVAGLDAAEIPALEVSVSAVAIDREGGLLVLAAGAGEVTAHRIEPQGGLRWRRLVLPTGARPGTAACAGDLVALAASDGGWVSVDGGARWHAAPLLAGATALAVVHSDDGAPGLLVGLYDARADRAAAVFAPVGAAGVLGAAQPVALPAERRPDDTDDADGDGRIERLVALDPAGRRMAVLTGRGTVWLIDRA